MLGLQAAMGKVSPRSFLVSAAVFHGQPHSSNGVQVFYGFLDPLSLPHQRSKVSFRFCLGRSMWRNISASFTLWLMPCKAAIHSPLGRFCRLVLCFEEIKPWSTMQITVGNRRDTHTKTHTRTCNETNVTFTSFSVEYPTEKEKTSTPSKSKEKKRKLSCFLCLFLSFLPCFLSPLYYWRSFSEPRRMRMATESFVQSCSVDGN